MKPLLLLACCLSLALPARAATDPFAEFRIPDHAWRMGEAQADFFVQRHHQSASGSFNRTNSLFTRTIDEFRAGWDSDALQYEFGLSAIGQLMTNHARSGSDAPPYTQREEQVGRQSGEGWNLEASLRSYPWKAPVGLGVGASAWGQYAQDWSRSDYRTSQDYPVVRSVESRSAGATHAYQTLASAEFSVGLGRVRDASVVYDVHLLEERLIGTGALTRALSPGARAKLAALDYVAPFFQFQHERPDRFIWREVERILREDGALGERGLDPYSVLRAREPVAPGGRPMRQRGWFVGPVGDLLTQHYISRSEQESDYRLYDSGALADEEHQRNGQRSTTSYDRCWMGCAAEYHRPVGWRWQVDAESRIAHPARPGENGLSVANRASVSWFVADRWSASASFTQQRDYFRPRDYHGALAYDRWMTQAGAGIAYYLEDRTSLTLTLSETQERVQYSPYSPRALFRDGRVSLGLSYRFLGRLDAPGLAGPVLPAN